MLTKDDQRALDSTFYDLRSLASDTRIARIAAQMDVKRREQKTQPSTRTSTTSSQMDVLLREKRKDRRQTAYRIMSPIYSTKSRANADAIHECYELKKKLPLSAQRRFEEEYNETPYGAEQALIDKYRRLYRI